VIAAALHVLRCAENFVDGRAQGFRTVDDEQIGAIGRQALIAQMNEQALDRSAFSVAPTSIPRMCLRPSRSTPTALKMWCAPNLWPSM